MLEKFDCFQILIAAVFVGDPLTVFFTVIKIQHGSNSIYAETIDVIMFDPEQCVGDQEVLNFCFTIIEDLGSPVRMFPFLRICIFKGSCAVKVSESVCIAWKMCRYPVKDYANLILMEVIDHICEIFRRTITGGRSIISGHLISPGAVKWVF